MSKPICAKNKTPHNACEAFLFELVCFFYFVTYITSFTALIIRAGFGNDASINVGA